MSGAKRRESRRIVLSSFLLVLACVLAAYALRFTFAAWYLNKNQQARAVIISVVTDEAPPIIERELHMTIPQSILSFLAGRRGEETRERDALEDSRAFTEMALRDHWLRFRDIHWRRNIKGFSLGDSDVALVWHRGGDEDVLAAFRLDLRKKKVSGIRINENSGYFADLRRYVEERAKKG